MSFSLRTLAPFVLTACLVGRLLAAPAPAAPRGPRPSLPSSAPGKPADAPTQKLLEQAVGGQLAAFNRNDYKGALRFASSSFRENFSPETFRAMIRAGYPQVAASKGATYGAARRSGDEALLPVEVAGRDGVKIRYIYSLGREGGAWRITGVVNLSPARRRPRPGLREV